MLLPIIKRPYLASNEIRYNKYTVPLREVARFWFPKTRSISLSKAEGNTSRSGQGEPQWKYKKELLKLAKSLKKYYHPKKGVLVEKTNTQFRVSQSVSLYILWCHVIVISVMPFLEDAVPHSLLLCTSESTSKKFNVCFGMINPSKYTISEVSKIPVPLDQTYSSRLCLGK